MAESKKSTSTDTGQSLVTLPEEVEQEVVAWIAQNCEDPAVEYRKQQAQDDEWAKMRRFYEPNRQWEGETVPSGFTPFEGNIIMPTIDTIKGIALQVPSVVEFIPMEADDERFCMELTAVISDYLWGVNKARFKLGMAFVDGAVVGTAWAKVFWNPELRGGEGDIDFEIIPAEDVWVDPMSMGSNNWNYLLHASRYPVMDVKYNDNYNERRSQVQSDKALSDSQTEGAAEEQFELVTVKEHWLRGIRLKALEAEVPGIGPHIDDDMRKWGMVITTANQLVIKLDSHPWRSDRTSFAKFVYYTPTGKQRVYGYGEAAYLRDTQISSNARVTQILNQAALIAAGQWEVSDLVVVDESELTSIPGQIIHVEGPVGVGLRRIDMPNISTGLFATQDLLMRMGEVIPGMYQVNRGEKPGSIRAGVAIEALQRGGEGRTLQKVYNFDDFVAELALIMADVMKVMYTSERTFRVVGATVNELYAQDMQKKAAAAVPTQNAEEAESLEEQMPERPTSYPVKISKESFQRPDGSEVNLDARALVGPLVRSTGELLEKDIALLNAGVVDAQYVIENNPLRNKMALLNRLFQTQAQAQMQGGMPAEEAAAQPPEGMEPPPTLSADEVNQVVQMAETMAAKIRELEAQGVVPEGFADQMLDAVRREIDSGGTGEMALESAAKQLQGYLQEGASPPQMGVPPGQGVAGPM